MPLAPGTRLGPYEIVSALGAGGMGEVYRARDTRLERMVAVKVLCETFGADARAALLREARAAAALNHPNICTIHEIADTADPMFIVMEHVEGRSMLTLVGEGLTHARVIHYGVQIADAVGHAHDRGVIHRDLKSANLIVTPDERVKVLDFGIAKQTGDAELTATRLATASGMICGTPAYMAPEVLRGGAADQRSDIWAIGVVLYEMTSGRRPFQGDTTFDVSAAILRDEPRALPKGAPAALRDAVVRCLAKDPAARFQRAHEIRSALETRAPEPTVKVRAPRARTAAVAPRASKWRIRSLAVLPLDNLSRNPDQEFLADGLTEELIAAVARIEDLRVIARQSIMRFKRTTKNVGEIARELGVDAVIAGSIKTFDDRVRVHVQLIDPRSEAYLWSANFENDLRDVHELERGIAAQVSHVIAAKIGAGPAASRRIGRAAHIEYLKGRQRWHRMTDPDTRVALQHFQAALESDPEYAAAYAGIALCHLEMAWFGSVTPSEAFPRVKAAAIRARDLDDSLAEAHAALGYVATFFDWDWVTADAELQRAIALDPASSVALLCRAWYLNTRADHDGALATLARAQELDPLSATIRGNAAFLAFFARRFEMAHAHWRAGLDLDPDFGRTNWVRGLILCAEERWVEALADFEAVRGEWRNVQVLGWSGYALARSGNETRARQLLAELERTGAAHAHVEAARVLVGLHDPTAAVTALEAACEAREPWLAYLAVDPSMDLLRANDRFTAILRRLG